jgi:hypothetical protein
MNLGNVHHRGLFGGFHQNVKIAGVSVITMHHRTEYPHIGDPVPQGNAPDGFAVDIQGKRGAHLGLSLRRGVSYPKK